MPVSQILERSVARWPDNPALDFMNKKISYRDLSDLSDRAAKGFQELGVRPGVHVGLYLPNTPHYVIAFFGVMKAGGTVVNYSPLDAEKVLEHKVDDSETDILVTLDLKAFYPQMGRLLGTTRLKTLVVGNVAEMTPSPAAVRDHMLKNGEIAPVPNDSKHVTFDDLLKNDGKYIEHPLADLRESVAVLQYTGGTTGLPKGAMLTHANLSSATAQYVETTHTQPQLLDEGRERVLAVLPPFHIYALTVNMLLGLRIGAELILHTRFDAPHSRIFAKRKLRSFQAYRRCMSRSSIIPVLKISTSLRSNGVRPAGLPFLSRCRSAFRTFPGVGSRVGE
jgi:long-chain acyl-CoA synthetase